jgi:hypothetical protein
MLNRKTIESRYGIPYSKYRIGSSSIIFSGIIAIKPKASNKELISALVRCKTIKRAKPYVNLSLTADAFRLRVTSIVTAGSNVKVNTIAQITPIAVILLSSANGREVAKLSVKKPMAVVTLVSTIGCKLRRRLSFIAYSALN